MTGAPALALWLAAGAVLAAEPAPAIEFRHDAAVDAQCAASRQPVQPAWARELHERLPEFESLWASVGPGMVASVQRLTNKPFAAPSTVTLTLCDVPSNAFAGITVNMRYALRSFTATPVPLRYKIDTVFHEALHAFVSRHTPRGSTLLEAHASEPFCVRNHLHLLALQKAVLLSIGDGLALDQVVAIDSQLPSGCYQRAWALVNATPEAYLRFVKELAR